MEKQSTNKLTILMFPWLAYSHVFPFLELAKKLSNRNFHIYFCSSAVNLDFIRKNETENNFTSHGSIELVQLQVPSLPELPPHLHTTKNLPPRLNPILLRAFQMSTPSFAEILIALKPDLLIYDFYQPWAPKMASSQNIPSVYLATSGAAPFSFFHHLYTHGTSLDFPYPEIYITDHEKMDHPVAPPVKDADEGFLFGVFELSSEIVLIRSSSGIEGKYIDYLSELCRKRAVPTGPLVASSSCEKDDECLEIMQWLSTKDRSSTVFVCFGSEHFLSGEQIGEIAKGLEMCSANFVWVVRFPEEEKKTHLEDALPAGFFDRVNKRGLVLQGWAPQGEILGHPSIGGFVSHCGWSSVMEGLHFGVPIIAVPIKFDQPINGRLVAGPAQGWRSRGT